MPDPATHSKDLLLLLHNIDLTAKENIKKFDELLPLLKNAAVDRSSLQRFRHESETMVAKKISPVLLEEISKLEPSDSPEYKVFRRETPFISSRVPASSPEWARGARPVFSIGPFAGIDGRLSWLDFFFYEKLVPVYVSGDNAPIMLIPLSLSRINKVQKNFTVVESSIWLRADLFAAGLTKKHYIGLRISGGDLSVNTAYKIINDALTINAADHLHLNLTLDNTFTAAGSSNEGIDARKSEITLPVSCKIDFAANKFSLSKLSDSKWKLYGDKKEFAFQGAAAYFDLFLNRLIFPLNPDPAVFEVITCDSKFFQISGAANVTHAGWCLNVAVMDSAKPFAVNGNGALGISCKEGLSYQWQGLDLPAGLVKAKEPIILAEPGKFSVGDGSALFNQHTEHYKLWQREAGKETRTNSTLTFKKEKPFIYYSDQVGYEGITATADANFKIDKPYKADGNSVSPDTINSLYIKYVNPGKCFMWLVDSDMLTDLTPSLDQLKEPDIYQFTITNAYMITTSPLGILLIGQVQDKNIIHNGWLLITYGLFKLLPILPHPYTTDQRLNRYEAAYVPDRIEFRKEASQWKDILINFVASSNIWDDANIVDNNTVTVDFELLTDLYRSLTIQTSATKITEEILKTQLEQDLVEEFSFVNNESREKGYYGQSLFSLLDLSTNYDLFGVSMVWNSRRYKAARLGNISPVSAGVVTIEKMNLQAPMILLNTFTLPHISWEPVNNLTEPKPANKYPPAGILSFPDSGPPTIFSQFDYSVIDIDPLKHLERFQSNLANNKGIHSHIIFGLPHGKVSIANLKYYDDQYAAVKGNLQFIRPEFKPAKDTVKGGIQFRMAASKEIDDRPMIEGMTYQLSNLLVNGPPETKSILGGIVLKIFLNNFYWIAGSEVPEKKADGVPVTHLDFSGYGASTYSDWRNPNAVIAQVSQTRFDVMVGRVSHEVVQVVSILYPWGIRVVRTITLHRSGNAIIYREDSGWIAQSDGLFNFYFKVEDGGEIENPFEFHPGLIKGLFNVHNIVETGENLIHVEYDVTGDTYVYESSSGKVKHAKDAGGTQKVNGQFAAVTFDADVEIENISVGAKNGRVTGKSFKGFLQVSPQAVPINAYGLNEIFKQQQNSIGGSVDCTMRIGNSEQTIHLNRVDVSVSFRLDDPSKYIFVVAAKGSVQLPNEGSWSVVEVDKVSGEVTPVANKQSVPVVRIGLRDRKISEFKLIDKESISRIAFGNSLFNKVSTFSKRYGYVQNTGSQKLLLTDPRIDQNIPISLTTEAPLLADTYRLLNSKGPFPNIKNAIEVENVTNALTEIWPGGLKKRIENFEVPDANLKFDIIGNDKEDLHMYVEYASNPSGGKKKTVINYITDSLGANAADKWKNELNNISVVVDMGPFKRLLTVSGNMKAKSSFDPGFDSGDAPQLVLCEDLKPIYEILEFLANLDPSKPVDAIKKGLKIAMSNTADSWEYKFKAEKEIPFVKFPFDPINYNSPTTPLKLDAFFKVGCYFNQPIKIPNTATSLMPSAGAYLELGADLRVMCFSLAAATVYATGRAVVGLAADVKSGPNLYFKFGFGIELTVGLPVIGSVSVMYLVGVDMKLTTTELTVGAFIYFRGRAEIFAGIVTITIQIEAAGKIYKELKDGPTNCVATCTFALDISIFLVIDINFTETWQETRQIA